ncbi:hypothetical protein IEO21_02568 [Rhodonia placenta]|uniref:F-box domain-containing protein n=1 Tax=Rhodonia placenta TaxID=104341 RepID=A0A8H7U525_9APHY|nr:hypothetical protein IEO21_02568 [Postia placenta]
MANAPELERNPALYALATTCTDFRDPALDLLWRKQKGLGNLIKCMPADLWQLHKCYVWNNASPYHRAEYDRLSFKRELNSSDWYRWDFYARRVREFGPTTRADARSGGSHMEMSKATYWTLMEHRPHPGILPNVIELDWRWAYSRVKYRFGHVLIAPSLKSLSLAFRNPETVEDAKALVAALSQSCPSLHTLKLQFSDVAVFDELSDIISGVRSLREFDLETNRSLPAELFRQLSSLPELTSLVLMVWTPDHLVFRPQTCTDASQLPCFDSLRSLIVNSDDLSTPTTVIAAGQFPDLQDLSVASDTGDVMALFQVIHAHCNPMSLQKLRIFRPEYGLKHQTRTEPASTLRQLRRFPNLQDIHIQVPRGIQPSDHDLEDLAAELGQIVNLYLAEILAMSPRSEDEYGNGVSLRALTTLVERCPRLERLTLDIDASTIDAQATQRSGKHITNSNLKSIRLGTASRPGDPGRVLAFLCDLAPKLQNIGFDYSGSSPEDREAWQKVVWRLHCKRVRAGKEREYCYSLPRDTNSDTETDT